MAKKKSKKTETRTPLHLKLFTLNTEDGTSNFIKLLDDKILELNAFARSAHALKRDLQSLTSKIKFSSRQRQNKIAELMEIIPDDLELVETIEKNIKEKKK